MAKMWSLCLLHLGSHFGYHLGLDTVQCEINTRTWKLRLEHTFHTVATLCTTPPSPSKQLVFYHDMQWNHFWSLKSNSIVSLILIFWECYFIEIFLHPLQGSRDSGNHSVPFIKLFLIESIYLSGVYIISTLCRALWTGSFSRINLTCELACPKKQTCACKYASWNISCSLGAVLRSRICVIFVYLLYILVDLDCKRYSWPYFLLVFLAACHLVFIGSAPSVSWIMCLMYSETSL